MKTGKYIEALQILPAHSTRVEVENVWVNVYLSGELDKDGVKKALEDAIGKMDCPPSADTWTEVNVPWGLFANYMMPMNAFRILGQIIGVLGEIAPNAKFHYDITVYGEDAEAAKEVAFRGMVRFYGRCTVEINGVPLDCKHHV